MKSIAYHAKRIVLHSVLCTFEHFEWSLMFICRQCESNSEFEGNTYTF